MKFTQFLAAAAALACAATAAPAASFDIEASARMTLIAATDSQGGDALGGLGMAFALDLVDDYPVSDGAALVATLFTPDEALGGVTASASGTASAPYGSATAQVEGRLVRIVTNLTAAPIEPVFRYLIATTGTADGFAEVAAGGHVELQDDLGSVFGEEISFFAPLPQGVSGEVRHTLGAGETLYAIAYGQVFGTASVFEPAPVPLPAGLPLLLAGLGGLTLLRCRRA